MKVRLLALVLVLSFAFVTTVGAQDITDLCYQLSAADCEFVQAAAANPASSFNYTMGLDFSADLSAIGMMEPGAPANVTISAQGNGSFNKDAMAFSANLQGSANDGTEEVPFDVGLVIVDGMAYFMTPDTDGQWMGGSLDSALEDAGLPFDPMALISGEMDPMDMAGGMGDTSALSAIEGFVTRARLADEDVMGQTTYPIQTTIDLAALFSSAEFMEMMSDADALGDDAAMVAMMVPMLTNGMVFNINHTQWYGANDSYTHRMQIDGDLSLDLAMLMQMVGGDEEIPDDLPPLTMKVIFWVELTDHNNAAPIVAPEGATIME